LFSIIKRKHYFNSIEQDQIISAIREAEKQSSGEIRLFVEGRCRYVNPVLRAEEIFLQLKKDQTKGRNAVLVYVAMKDKQLAVYGDRGIHEKVGDEFWNRQIASILQHFDKKNYVHGLTKIIEETGQALASHFPYDPQGDINELPDDIVYGR
jgi:uncharacterized membrane protein